ncbi:hypothetical protein [Streptomyces sp. SID3212]|uniref:hypothetical protein n=1 Tax=Streptomyces sp. SID3212 TaxID=2690259 RepID=UPI0013680868|nr:hypothetical protein [Streptomyces sp. SID3212]MYV56496.1 hypothetical protein [Streptomyces sp. SID3212]
MRVSSFAKALAAAAAAGAASVSTAVLDGTFTTGEGVTAVLSVLGALGITYAVPNKRPSA